MAHEDRVNHWPHLQEPVTGLPGHLVVWRDWHHLEILCGSGWGQAEASCLCQAKEHRQPLPPAPGTPAELCWQLPAPHQELQGLSSAWAMPVSPP